jgi:bifunctional non-homologous end joining protein LigD
MSGAEEPRAWVAPMLAQTLDLGSEPGALRSGDWVFERKLDGLRCLAVRFGSQVELLSRNRLPFGGRFQAIRDAVGALPVDDLVLDGEMVAFDAEGKTSFSLLQSPDHDVSPTYCVFDLVRLLGSDTTPLPHSERRALLQKALSGAPSAIQVVPQLLGDASGLLQEACDAGWEGLVAKRASSPYRSGRSGDWRKLKCSSRQELVVGGWTDPSGSRTGFGALLVGYYDDEGRLRYAGRVGTGFDSRDLRTIYSELRRLEAAASPFADAPPGRGVHWAAPALVAEVNFTEWTRDGRLRHPSFLGLREDKDPAQVRREDTHYPGPP